MRLSYLYTVQVLLRCNNRSVVCHCQSVQSLQSGQDGQSVSDLRYYQVRMDNLCQICDITRSKCQVCLDFLNPAIASRRCSSIPGHFSWYYISPMCQRRLLKDTSTVSMNIKKSILAFAYVRGVKHKLDVLETFSGSKLLVFIQLFSTDESWIGSFPN